MDQRERDRLVSEYYAAVKSYSDAVRGLIGLNGAEFEQAHRKAESFREICEKRRAVLKDYEKDFFRNRPSSPPASL